MVYTVIKKKQANKKKTKPQPKKKVIAKKTLKVNKIAGKTTAKVVNKTNKAKNLKKINGKNDSQQ